MSESKMSTKKLVYIYPSKPSFIQQDLDILKKHFNVRCIDVGKTKRSLLQKGILIAKMIYDILWADISFTWFANNHAYAMVKLSKYFRKKSMVIIGGFEVANEPEIGYGGQLDPILAKRIKYILGNADEIISVSKFSEKEIYKISKPKSIKLIYNSVDSNKFQPGNIKENIVITVCIVDKKNIIRKGLETFVKTAAILPETRFVIIGKWIDEAIEDLKAKASKNVEFTGFVSDEELLEWYQKSKVYCQLSYYESFGVALAESMACECVPVIAERGAMPEVAGDTGFMVPYGNPEATAEAIKKALISENGPAARKRVLELFRTEDREYKLIEACQNL